MQPACRYLPSVTSPACPHRPHRQATRLAEEPFQALPTRFSAAPMAGITDQAFRLVLRLVFKGLIFSEMVSATGVYYNPQRQERYIRFSSLERPIALQLFGKTPGHFYHAARRLNSPAPDVLDINMGCPARKVRTSGSGSALLANSALARDIVAAAVAGFDGPVSVKIRILDAENTDKTLRFIDNLADLGVSFVTVHLRTATQLFHGTPDYAAFAPMFAYNRLPLVINGGISSMEQVRGLQALGARWFMLGHAMLGRPWVFQRLTTQEPAASVYAENWRLLVDMYPFLAEEGPRVASIPAIHLRLLAHIKGAHMVKEFRKHFNWYCRGTEGARDLRNRVNHIEDAGAMHAITRETFCQWQPRS